VGTFSFGISAGSIGGTIGQGVMTETGTDGTTVRNADDMSTRVPVTVNAANATGLEVVVRSPAR
jgi:hypothetical protein